jgi:poly [ADP-ribose] polymerase
MPLGRLTKEQILAGYKTLKDIEDLIKRGASSRELMDASSEFYTRIPHAFGMRRPPVIASLDDVRTKLALVEVSCPASTYFPPSPVLHGCRGEEG